MLPLFRSCKIVFFLTSMPSFTLFVHLAYRNKDVSILSFSPLLLECGRWFILHYVRLICKSAHIYRALSVDVPGGVQVVGQVYV